MSEAAERSSRMSTEEREAAVRRAASVESHPPPVCLESRLVDLEEECRRDTVHVCR